MNTRKQLIPIFFVVCILLISQIACRTVKSDRSARRPNLIFVFTDQQPAWEWSGETPVILTPNLERIARNGMAFTNFVSNNPICVPMRAILMTGQYSQQNGFFWNSLRSMLDGSPGISPEAPAWPKILRDAGYKMGYVGKLHLYPFRKLEQTIQGNNGKDIPLVEDAPAEYRIGFDHYWRPSQNYQDRYNTWYYDDKGNPRLINEYAPYGQMRQTIEFIKENRDHPFCVVLSWHPPHPSYAQVPEKWVKYYEDQQITRRKNVSGENGDKRLDNKLIGAYAHVSAMDEAMGWLLDTLEELELEQNTIVMFTSDHGDMLGSQGWLNKRTPWTESVNVPFLIQWEGTIPASRKSRVPLSTIDLAPTLLGLCDLASDVRMQGADYSDFILGKRKSDSPESAFIMHIQETSPSENGSERLSTGHNERKSMNFDWRGIKTEQYTYVFKKEHNTDPVAESWLLFNDLDDPFQLNNLINDPSASRIREDLDEILRSYLDQVGEKDWLGK